MLPRAKARRTAPDRDRDCGGPGQALGTSGIGGRLHAAEAGRGAPDRRRRPAPPRWMFAASLHVTATRRAAVFRFSEMPSSWSTPSRWPASALHVSLKCSDQPAVFANDALRHRWPYMRRPCLNAAYEVAVSGVTGRMMDVGIWQRACIRVGLMAGSVGRSSIEVDGQLMDPMMAALVRAARRMAPGQGAPDAAGLDQVSLTALRRQYASSSGLVGL